MLSGDSKSSTHLNVKLGNQKEVYYKQKIERIKVYEHFNSTFFNYIQFENTIYSSKGNGNRISLKLCKIKC